MKSKLQLEQSLSKIITKIGMYFDKSSIAMANGNNYEEDECEEMIKVLEDKKDFIEWVLN